MDPDEHEQQVHRGPVCKPTSLDLPELIAGRHRPFSTGTSWFILHTSACGGSRLGPAAGCRQESLARRELNARLQPQGGEKHQPRASRGSVRPDRAGLWLASYSNQFSTLSPGTCSKWRTLRVTSVSPKCFAVAAIRPSE